MATFAGWLGRLVRTQLPSVSIRQDNDDSGVASDDRLIINTSQKKHVISLAGGMGQAKQALASAGML